MKQLPLIHPIYLDVPMLVSFAAATQGGLSFGTESTTEEGTQNTRDAKIAGKFSVSNLLNAFLDISLDASAETGSEKTKRTTTTESKSHTEASIAILLYDFLTKQDGYLTSPTAHDEFEQIGPGSLVQLSGTLEKNAIDAMFDAANAIEIIASLADGDEDIASEIIPPQSRSQRKKRNRTPNPSPDEKEGPLTFFKNAITKDRDRTPISNAILTCDQPEGVAGVITLRTANLRDLTLSELHKNSVRVVGKVTRLIGEGQSMCPFENYGFALLKADKLRETFNAFETEASEMRFDLTDVEISGPAVQILPLMIFV